MSVIHKILFAFIEVLAISFTMQANNWQKQYMADEFGDPDYSNPVYVISCVNPNDNLIHIDIAYNNGIFILDPRYYSAHVDGATTVKAKGANGTVYQFDFEKPNRNSNLHIISKDSDVDNLINLLEQGNFTLSFHRSANYMQDSYNYNFRIGQQGLGIRSIYENDFPQMLSHEAQGLPDTYKGTLGSYQITMQLHASASSPSNPDVFPVSGVYWYGNGSNGKMTLKGTLSYQTGGIGVYKLEEYDPNGKKCGSFALNENSDVQTYITTLVGKMTNAKGQTFNVNLTQQ